MSDIDPDLVRAIAFGLVTVAAAVVTVWAYIKLRELRRARKSREVGNGRR